jgi:anaerobic selenocysteine-containing dehydrogenase
VLREPEPYLEIHPDDAALIGVGNGETTLVSSRRGTIRLPARLATTVPRGTVFLPFHWGDLFTPDNAVNYLTIGATDAVSRQPELKFCAVSLEKLVACTALDEPDGCTLENELVSAALRR